MRGPGSGNQLPNAIHARSSRNCDAVVTRPWRGGASSGGGDAPGEQVGAREGRRLCQVEWLDARSIHMVARRIISQAEDKLRGGSVLLAVGKCCDIALMSDESGEMVVLARAVACIGGQSRRCQDLVARGCWRSCLLTVIWPRPRNRFHAISRHFTISACYNERVVRCDEARRELQSDVHAISRWTSER